MDKTQSQPGKLQSRNYQPLFIFFGFLLLGAALALVLFGGNLLNSPDTNSVENSNQSLLDQVADLSETDFEAATEVDKVGYLDAGDRARDFTLLDFSGNSVSLADFEGNPVIMNLWATWCAPCRIEMPALQEINDKYQPDGLAILALNQDEPVEVASEYFYDEMNLSFIPLQDINSSVAAEYGGLNVLPTTYFIDRDGIISAIHHGPMTVGQIEGYLAEMLPAGQ
jgi:peroxiredoxin